MLQHPEWAFERLGTASGNRQACQEAPMFEEDNGVADGA